MNGHPPTGTAIEIERPQPGSHRTTVVLDGGRRVDTLADLPPVRDKLLFVGLHPSPDSVEAGHYHREPRGRTFWERLVRATILPPGTLPDAADDALLAAGHGITDLLKDPAHDWVRGPSLRSGVGPLWQKVAIWRPAAVVFIDRRGAEAAAGRELTEKWGQLVGVALSGRPCFLMPAHDAPTEEVDEGLNLLRNLAASLPG